MKFVTTLFLSLTFLLTGCFNKNSQAIVGNNIPKVSENQIKVNPQTTQYDSIILYTGWYYIVDAENGIKRQLDKSDDTFFIDPKPIVVAKNFTTFEIYENYAGGQKNIGLTMWLDKQGTESWSVATEKAIGKQLAFILDNRLLYVAKVNSQITAGVTALNRGNYSKSELENFKTIIESEK